MDAFLSNVRAYFPLKISAIDIVEIIIISVLFYHVLLWIKNTRAWILFKGMAVVFLFFLIASFFRLNTILWLVDRLLNIGIIALVIVFQPELRRALEQLGKKNIFSNIFTIDDSKDVKERFSDKTVNELVKTAFELSKTKTGALIVIEQEISLEEYERTGIEVDAVVTNQLLINIFEHNTPLHDGAVIVRGDRVTYATCYLPLSDNMGISKELGTRHRAALGVSEMTDSLTIIVSEQTGKVSVALGGQLYRGISADELREKLINVQNKKVDIHRFKIWKGKSKADEKKAYK